MPWRDSSPMDLKTQFIADYLRQMLSISELCLHYNISRKTAYKWIDRYLDQGPTGLEDRARRPHLRSPSDPGQSRRGHPRRTSSSSDLGSQETAQASLTTRAGHGVAFQINRLRSARAPRPH